MKPESVIVYERVLNGERWPTQYVGTATSSERTAEILRYLFFDLLGIRDFESAKQIVNAEFFKKYKLDMVVARMEKPAELLPEEYDHVLWIVFPDRRKEQRALTVKVYSEVLSGRRRTFPRGYFSDPKLGKYRADVCVKHLCRRVLHLSGDRIAREFAHSKGIKTLAKFKLRIVLNTVYTSLSDMIYHVFPQYYPRLEYYQRILDQRRYRWRKEENEDSQCICNASRQESRDSGEDQ